MKDKINKKKQELLLKKIPVYVVFKLSQKVCVHLQYRDAKIQRYRNLKVCKTVVSEMPNRTGAFYKN